MIAADWADANRATVTVQLDAPTCLPSDPQLAVSPAESPWVIPGTPVTYTVAVTNRDSVACDAGMFDLGATVPDAWSAAFAEPALSLPPGASASTTVNVTSSPWAGDGFYEIGVTGASRAAPEFAATTFATYVVSAGVVNEPPVAVDDDATTTALAPVVIAVHANDFDPDGDALTVAAVTAASKGSASINPDGTVTYLPDRKAKGFDRFDYIVSDGLGTASGAVVVRIRNDPGGKGG